MLDVVIDGRKVGVVSSLGEIEVDLGGGDVASVAFRTPGIGITGVPHAKYATLIDRLSSPGPAEQGAARIQDQAPVLVRAMDGASPDDTLILDAVVAVVGEAKAFRYRSDVTGVLKTLLAERASLQEFAAQLMEHAAGGELLPDVVHRLATAAGAAAEVRIPAEQPKRGRKRKDPDADASPVKTVEGGGPPDPAWQAPKLPAPPVETPPVVDPVAPVLPKDPMDDVMKMLLDLPQMAPILKIKEGGALADSFAVRLIYGKPAAAVDVAKDSWANYINADDLATKGVQDFMRILHEVHKRRPGHWTGLEAAVQNPDYPAKVAERFAKITQRPAASK